MLFLLVSSWGAGAASCILLSVFLLFYSASAASSVAGQKPLVLPDALREYWTTPAPVHNQTAICQQTCNRGERRSTYVEPTPRKNTQE
jgi:hypothetical protein